MHPILFKIGPVTIYSYGVALALAFIVSVFLAGRLAKQKKINPSKIVDLGLIVIIFGILGARLLHALVNLDYYLKSPLEIIMLQRGGLAFHGALLLAIPAGMFFIQRQKLPQAETVDLVIPFVALGQAIGRIGCFLNGCCFGVASGCFLAVKFPQLPQTVHPTQLYSSLALLLIFIILRIFQERKHFPGEVFIAYGLLYSALRFFMDFIRDLPPLLWRLKLTQLLSLVFFIIFLSILILRLRASTFTQHSEQCRRAQD